MKSMNLGENENEIEGLSQILSKIQNLYYKKKNQLEEIQMEISELKDVLNFLNSLISNKSFQSADEIYSKSLMKKDENAIEENYFVEDLPKEKVEGTNIKRKIFSNDKENEEGLLCILNFFDLNHVEIKFIAPEERSIKETSEDFIRIIIRGALIKIKETNPNMSLNYDYYKNTDLIESINITNISSINEYDLITAKIRELLAIDILQ
jgi:hypothetical protein